MASNLVIARGAVDDVPPISLAFWRWLTVFLILRMDSFQSFILFLLKAFLSEIYKDFNELEVN